MELYYWLIPLTLIILAISLVCLYRENKGVFYVFGVLALLTASLSTWSAASELKRQQYEAQYATYTFCHDGIQYQRNRVQRTVEVNMEGGIPKDC